MDIRVVGATHLLGHPVGRMAYRAAAYPDRVNGDHPSCMTEEKDRPECICPKNASFFGQISRRPITQ